MGFFSSSSKQQNTPSWTSGSFPGGVIPATGYTYAYSYSPQPVWQAQPALAVPQYSVTPIQSPIQVVPMSIPAARPTTTTFVSSPTVITTTLPQPQPQPSTYTVVQQQSVTTSPSGGQNALFLSVPSPRITHAIPASPRRSPRPQAPSPLPAQEHMLVLTQGQSQQAYLTQQQQSPMTFNVTLNLSPQQAQALLPGSTPGPFIEEVPEREDHEPESHDGPEAQFESGEFHHHPPPHPPSPHPHHPHPPQPQHPPPPQPPQHRGSPRTRKQPPPTPGPNPTHFSFSFSVPSPNPPLSALAVPTLLPLP